MDYNKTIERVDILCKQHGISKTTAYIKSDVGKDFGANIKKGYVPSSDKILALANFFECSVDYLLERTDNPTSHLTQAGSTVNNAPISGNFNSIGNSGSINVSTTEHALDDNEKALLEYYNELSPLDKAQLLLDIAKMSKKKKIYNNRR